MRSAIISITFLLIMFKFSWAQDTITRKTGVKIICNIIKVDSINIHYHIRKKNGTEVKTFLPLEGVFEYKYGPKLERPNFWFNVGVGAGTVIGGFDSNHTDNAVGPSFGINFSSQIKKGLLSIRFIYNEEMVFLRMSPKQSVSDFGVLYGRIAKIPLGFVSLSGGISRVFGEQRGAFQNLSNYTFNYEQKTFSTFGIPLESQLFWTPSSVIGFGIYGFANINPEKSFFGGLFCIQLGKLKYK
ncbi:MAG: hypothetical protein WCK18_06465 [Prolixibacteraceae bacterium]